MLGGLDVSRAPDPEDESRLVSPRPAMVIARDAAREFLDRFNRGAACFDLTDKQLEALRIITGQRGAPAKLLLSDIPLRLKLTEHLIEGWRQHWFKHHQDADRRYMSVTIITDSGNTLARRSVIDLEALRRRADKLLRQAGLDAVFILEVQQLTNFPRCGNGGSHQWHVHAIATTNRADFDIESTERALRVSDRLSNLFGAPTVKIRRIQSLADLMRCCAYLSKAPAVGKRIAPNPEIPKEWTFKKVFVPKNEVFRLVEAVSQVQVGHVLHSVGEGKHVLRPVMKAIRTWHKARYFKTGKWLGPDFDIGGLWSGIRRSRANNLYATYIFSEKGSPREVEWERLARQALDAMNAARDQKWLSQAQRRKTSIDGIASAARIDCKPMSAINMLNRTICSDLDLD